MKPRQIKFKKPYLAKEGAEQKDSGTPESAKEKLEITLDSPQHQYKQSKMDLSLDQYEKLEMERAVCQLIARRLAKTCLELGLTEAQAYRVLLKDLSRVQLTSQMSSSLEKLSFEQRCLVMGFLPHDTLGRNFSLLYNEITQKDSYPDNKKYNCLVYIAKCFLEANPDKTFRDWYTETLGSHFPLHSTREDVGKYLKLNPTTINFFLRIFVGSYFERLGDFCEFIFSVAQEKRSKKLPTINLSAKKDKYFLTKENRVCVYSYRLHRLQFFDLPPVEREQKQAVNQGHQAEAPPIAPTLPPLVLPKRLKA